MSEVLYYEIKASREFPMRSELTRLARCTRDDEVCQIGKWTIEIFEFPMNGIIDTTFAYDSQLRDMRIGRTICSKVSCALSFGSKIEWAANWRKIDLTEALDLLDLIKA